MEATELKIFKMTIKPTDDQVKKMVDRFLCWPLPKDFSPDGGVTFDRRVNLIVNGKLKECDRGDAPSGYWPVGTNLLTADQAKEMIEYLLSFEINAE